jgi:hypothetical protein
MKTGLAIEWGLFLEASSKSTDSSASSSSSLVAPTDLSGSRRKAIPLGTD